MSDEGLATRLQHAFGNFGDTRRASARIGETMKTSRKTLGPSADQGMPPQLLTTEEVAVWLQMAPKTLRNWRSAGLGPPALKLYGVVRYQSTAVEAWLADTSKAAA